MTSTSSSAPEPGTDAAPSPALAAPSIALLIVVGAFSPFALTISVPALPDLSNAFGVSLDRSQFIISLFLLGLAAAQPVHGILADHFGRRPVLIGAFSLFLLATLACAFAPDINTLIGLRIVQALGVAAGTVVARAVIRDTSGPEESMRLIAYLAAGIGLAPTIAPMLGGVVVESWGWRGSFYLAAGAALVVWVWLVRGLPETLQHSHAIRDDVGAGTGRILIVIRSPAFWGYTLTYGFSNAGFFCFLTNGPTFFAEALNIGPRAFGVFIGALSGAYVCGAYLSSALVRRAGMWRTLRFGVIAMIGSAIIVLGAPLVTEPSVLAIGLPFMLLYAATGVVNPAAMTGAVMCRQEVAGTASGLSSSMGMAIGALGATVASYFYTGSFLSVVAPVSGTVVVVAIAYLLVVLDRGHRETYHGA